MSIVQLEPFDLATAQPWKMLASAGFWAALPRLARGIPSARLWMVADTLRRDQVSAGFGAVAAPAGLVAGARAYKFQYEEFLHEAVNDVRYIRVYLVVDTLLPDDALCNLLSTYGMAARPLDHAVPLPFSLGRDDWHTVADEAGTRWAALRSTASQFGSIFPRTLHRLFALDFPVWVALTVYTYPERDAARLLRLKSVQARYDQRKTLESAQEADDMGQTVLRLRAEMNRAGAALHTMRLYAVTGAPQHGELNTRLEMLRAALPLDMERVQPVGDTLKRVFHVHPLGNDDGAMLATPGLALLTGSALSYRRRTQTRGVLLGIDRNQAPVILNIFDPDNASYNMVVLGQTGSGKTFAVLLLMLRHLLTGARLVIVDPQGNVDLSWLGDEAYHKAVLGTGAASINLLDITHAELGAQVESVCALLSLLGVFDKHDSVARAVLDAVLLDIYRPIWGQGVPVPTLQALQRRLQWVASDSGQPTGVVQTATRLHYLLTPFVDGSYAEYFGRPTTVDFSLSKAANVFDVSRLPGQGQAGNLRAAFLSLVVNSINQSIRRARLAGDTTPMLFFVDEMGMLMRDPVLAAYVSAEYKTARARRVGMIVADQDLHSLLGPQDESGLHHGAPMLANAAFALLFYQRDSERERVMQNFPGLPAEMREAIFQLPRGVCVAQLPDDILLTHVRASEFERTVLSSQLHDRARAKAVMARLRAELGASS